MQLSQSQIRLNHVKYQNGNVRMERAYRHRNIAMVNQIAWIKVTSRANVVVSNLIKEINIKTLWPDCFSLMNTKRLPFVKQRLFCHQIFNLSFDILFHIFSTLTEL